MKLSELMSSFGLWIFPVVGLLGFFFAFLFVLARVARTPREEVRSNAFLPLDDGTCDGPAGQHAMTERGL